MNFRFVIALALAGCAGGSAGSAEDQIAMYAISSEDARASDDSTEAAVAESFAAPRPMGECDPRGAFAETFDRFDHDGDGAIEGEESDEVDEELGPRDEAHRGPREAMWELLSTVYDTDGDGELSDAEREDLLGDFEVRCEAMHDRLLADFDADGDGELSEEEMEAAHDAMPEPPEGEEGHEGPPPMGEEGECERPEGPPPEGETSPLVAEFDSDGDGELSDSELATLRETVRERIREGAPLLPPPPVPAE
jgi:Ca2+-binding EF-hand superfamily protein